jgi:hypothetical protein
MPSCFLRHTDLVGNLFLIKLLLNLRFLFLFLDHHAGHLALHDARILLYECAFEALLFFPSSFRSIGSLHPIGRHSNSLCSAKTTSRLTTKLICSFLLDRRARYSTCRWLQGFVMTLLSSLSLHITWGLVRHTYP